jgi:2-hydroxymuconate-semialdehyde hydrolase
MGLPFPVNPATERIWSFPRDRTELIAAAKTLIFDERLIDEAYLTNRERVLRTSDYQTYFSAMFGGDKQRFIDATVITDEEFARIRCPVTLLHGREDQGFPANALSLAIIEKLPQATLTLIAACGHSVAMEHPKKFLAAADDIFPLMRAVQEAAS